MSRKRQIRLRKANQSDVSEVTAIEKASFGEFAWTRGEVSRTISDDMIASYVAEDYESSGRRRLLSKQPVIGYLFVNRVDIFVGFKDDKRRYMRRFDILSLAVDSRYRRQGVASRMVKIAKHLLFEEAIRASASEQQQQMRMHAVVSDANLMAQLFLKAIGFKAQVPVVRSAFFDAHDVASDGYLFVSKVKQAELEEAEAVA